MLQHPSSSIALALFALLAAALAAKQCTAQVADEIMPPGIDFGDVELFDPKPSTPDPPSSAVQNAIDTCGEIIDAHLHESIFFPTSDSLVKEMEGSYVSRGVLMAVYGAKPSPFSDDPNTSVQQFAEESDGIIYGLVSLNTTHSNWTAVKNVELDRLAKSLEMPAVVGAKLAPPHTCLELASQTMRDIVGTVSRSSKPLLYVHVGTTPFCGPFGMLTSGMIGCCSQEYVDARYLEILIAQHSDMTFVLLHAGHDFLEESSEYYYKNDMVDAALQVASAYPNVYLEISALLKQPLADVTMKKIVDAGLMSRVVYGSDVNHFPGAMLPYLELAVPAMLDAGFSEEALCLTLRGNSIELFGLPEMPPGGDDGQTVVPEMEPTAMADIESTAQPSGSGDDGSTGTSGAAMMTVPHRFNSVIFVLVSVYAFLCVIHY